MRTITSKIFGIIDYSIAFLLFASPVIFDYPEDSLHCRILMVSGLSLLLISLLTDHDFYLLKIFSFKNHLRINFLLGLILAFSPHLFELSNATILPHIFLGICLMVSSVIGMKTFKIKDLITNYNS